MDKQMIVTWAMRYDNDYPRWVDREKKIGDRLRATKELSKSDLMHIIEWKFEWLKGRRTRLTGLVQQNDDFIIKSISKLVLGLDQKYDRHKIKLLCILDGVGPAVASVILSFFDAQNYGVFDIHVWRELFGKEPKNLFTAKNCIRLFAELRALSIECHLPVRIVEKALFKKNYDEDK